MPRTEKTKIGALVTWVEYDTPVKDAKGNWSTTAIGKVRFQHDDGTTYVAETVEKTAYGHSLEHAVEGVLKRAGNCVARTVASILECQEPRIKGD